MQYFFFLHGTSARRTPGSHPPLQSRFRRFHRFPNQSSLVKLDHRCMHFLCIFWTIQDSTVSRGSSKCKKKKKTFVCVGLWQYNIIGLKINNILEGREKFECPSELAEFMHAKFKSHANEIIRTERMLKMSLILIFYIQIFIHRLSCVKCRQFPKSKGIGSFIVYFCSCAEGKWTMIWGKPAQHIWWLKYK